MRRELYLQLYYSPLADFLLAGSIAITGHLREGNMGAFRKFLAALGLVAAAAVTASPASAGGWDYDDYYYGERVVHSHVYLPPRYVHVYHVHAPVRRYVHVIGYEHAGYDAYRYARPYNYGIYWSAPYYRNYYPVRAQYPKARPYRYRDMK